MNTKVRGNSATVGIATQASAIERGGKHVSNFIRDLTVPSCGDKYTV